MLRVMQLIFGMYQSREALDAFSFHYVSALEFDGSNFFPKHETQVIVD